MPQLFVVAGVNGSGKSTLTQTMRFNNLRIIDPDAIAKERNNNASASARGEGGRAAIIRSREYLTMGNTFVRETTLAGHSIYRLMQKALGKAYRVELHYIYLTDAEQSADRVNTRVSKGGHDIPLEDIIRRFPRSRKNFEEAALISHKVVVYDNGGYEASLNFSPVMVADSDDLQIDKNAPEWLHESVARIRERAAAAGGDTADIWCKELRIIASPKAPDAD